MNPPLLSRRRFLISGLGAAAGLMLTQCKPTGSSGLVLPSGSAVAQAEKRRSAGAGPVRQVELAAAPAQIELDGRAVSTWAYGGSVPGPEIRVKAGDVLEVRFRNELSDNTSVHWHGIALRNDMDGVPPFTQKPVLSKGSFLYRFTVPDPGTYFFHPHVGLQLDRGLYAPLIVEDPSEPGDYDQELVVVLDDWTDGVGRSPDDIFKSLRSAGASMPGVGMGGGMPGVGMGGGMPGVGMGGPLKGDAGDVFYPMYLLNGKSKGNPKTFQAKKGQRIRLRVINAASDTAFRFAVQDHVLDVTHTDGFPVEPAPADAVLLGMGERFDALITVAGDGVYPMVASAEGKRDIARALLRSGQGEIPAADFLPPNLNINPVLLSQLRGAQGGRLPAKRIDRTHRVVLGADKKRYIWTLNGKTLDDSAPLEVQQGERVRLVFTNRTSMFHPMHLHGHTFEVQRSGAPGPRKDTVTVLPDERVTVDFDAGNPGQWMLHCHNLYHQEAGMMVKLGYLRNQS